MKESLVQWTLLQNLNYLSKSLEFNISTKKGQEVTTDFGRIDFIVEDYFKNHLIVELETILDTKSKRDYCFNQVINYKKVNFSDKTSYCILFARETNSKAKTIIEEFGRRNDILIKTYSINEVKSLYATTVERLSLSFGLTLPKPANYTISYLRWLNKVLKPFSDSISDVLSKNELAKYFSSYTSTNFKCYLKLALDFEMLTNDNDDLYQITIHGKDYVQNFNPDIDFTTNLSSVDLTNEQKRCY